MTSPNPPPTKAEIAQMLETRGILPTTQRVDIAAVVLATKQHVSAEQVLMRARNDGITV